MKALVKKKPEIGLVMEDAPMPEVGANDVLVKIKKTAICGTDLHIYNWDEWSQKTIPVPMIIGHEFAGDVVEIGSEVQGIKVGDRVSGEGHITCGHCRNCKAGKRHLCRNTIGIGVNRTGCFAEYLSIPASNVFILPKDISYELGSILDPLGNAVHTALSFDLVGEDILITGAGPIGIMAVAIAKFAGARYVAITDVNDYRLEIAKKIGANKTINVSKQTITETMQELHMVEGFDVGLEMSGNISALTQMLKYMNYGGKVSLLGIFPEEVKINLNDVIFKGLFLKGIYGREIFETWYKSSSMLQSGLDLTDIITHRFPIDDFEKGFQVMKSGKSGKVILNWD